MGQTTTMERLAACDLLRTRFAGRAALRKEAGRDLVALARLEVRLGLAGEDAVERAAYEQATERLADIAAGGGGQEREQLARELLPLSHAERWTRAWRAYRERRISLVDAVDPGRAVTARDLAARRRDEHESRVDKLAQRRPGHALRTYARRVAKRLVELAGFRTATHWHDDKIVLVESGHESATSSIDRMSPRDVGLPNAYAKQGFTVAASSHTYQFSLQSLLDKAVRHATRQGELYLRADLRVVQGRGTSLTIEHLAATARGGLRWTR